MGFGVGMLSFSEHLDTSDLFDKCLHHVGNYLEIYHILEIDRILGKVLYPEAGWAQGQAGQRTGHSTKPDGAEVLDNHIWCDSWAVPCRARSWTLIIESPFQQIFYDSVILEYVTI